MKISAAKTICKRKRYAQIFNEKREDGSIKRQFLSTGEAIYQLENMPLIDAENLMTIFDVSPKQREKWHAVITDAPDRLSFEDYTQNEYQLEESNVGISMEGKLLGALHTKNGVLFVDTELLKPISGNMEMLTFWERKSTLGETFIAVKVGMQLKAIIYPFDNITSSFAVALDAISQGVLAYVGEDQESCERGKS